MAAPRRTLVRRSCPTDEGPHPLRPRSCRSPARRLVGHHLWAGACRITPVDVPAGRTVEWEVVS